MDDHKALNNKNIRNAKNIIQISSPASNLAHELD